MNHEPRSLRTAPAAPCALFAALLGAALAGCPPPRPPEATPRELSAPSQTFSNPLLAKGQDPSVALHDGHYYLVQSDDEGLTVRRSLTLTGLGQARQRVVFTFGAQGSPCCEYWAPELLPLDGQWYIYVAADDGRNENHRMYVLESDRPDGDYRFKGQITDPTDRWAIDGTVLEVGGKRFFVWSGWAGTTNVAQDLYIARMSNPWTIEGERVLISSPTEPWERLGGDGVKWPYINEGPQPLQHGGRTFIVYSASGSWSDDYCLGLLTLEGSDPLQAQAWRKSPGCVFARDDAAAVFAPGHNGFTVSPDGAEPWQLYHAIPKIGASWQGRSVRAQRFAWGAGGAPEFGKPAALAVRLQLPAGEHEAEQALLQRAARVARTHASGGAVVALSGPTSSITFRHLEQAAGRRALRLRFANAGAQPAEHALRVNSGAAIAVRYPPTGGSDEQQTLRLDVALAAGLNTLQLSGRSGAAELDAITIAPR